MKESLIDRWTERLFKYMIIVLLHRSKTRHGVLMRVQHDYFVFLKLYFAIIDTYMHIYPFIYLSISFYLFI